MGCSTSSQTSAVDTTRPNSKPEESNGTSTKGAAEENGTVAEDRETIPDQTPAEGSNAKPETKATAAATSTESSPASLPAGEESPPSADTKPATAGGAEDAPVEAPPADNSAKAEPSSPKVAAPEQGTATDSEPQPEVAPAPSE
ncbi:hypothetical protein CHARACLAT_001180 [Characodon lateralis]|uniref:Uncharacterized protein n=1 Tax=Characodon lateralis TaxID=208331 RepID=A0ABU7DMB3_9TELE|nr:hypothetical protein [Characodon lateralis]